MTTIAFAAPILPGKLDLAHEMVSLIKGDRNAEAVAIRKEAGLDREQVFVQTTPMGEFAIVVWDTADATKVFEVFGSTQSEYATWFRGCLKEIHGFDIADPTSAPSWTVLGDWHSSDWKFDKFEGGAVCFPITEGKTALAETFVSAIMAGGSHHDEYVSTREDLGLYRQMFVVLNTPKGAIQIMYGEGNEGWFTNAFKTTATSDDSFYTWFRNAITEYSAVPIFAEPNQVPVEQILHLTVNVPANV